MWWPLRMFLALGVLLLLQSAWSFIDGIRFLRLVRRKRSCPEGTHTPPAAVVIPCKAGDPGFDANLDRFLNQDYPNYQVVFTVATEDDPAYRQIRERLDSRAASGMICNSRTSLVVAGVTEERGEKVNNLLRGLEQVDQTAEVLAFADMDASPSSNWLRSLVAPLASSQVTVSTGFRWYLPGEGFASRLRAAWDTSIATFMGDHNHNPAWGGSMAIRAADFHRLHIAERHWASTVSDDCSLSRAVREAGGTIRFEPRCLVASREESSLWEFLRWSARQMIITRVYAPVLWRMGLAVSLFYCGTVVWGLALLGTPGVTTHQRLVVAILLLAAILLNGGKGYIRTLVTRELFGAETDRSDSCYWLLSPLVSWVMLVNLVMAAFTRRIEWRGTEYELVSAEKVRVVRRTGP